MTEKDQFKFDVVIGNPPYQEESNGENNSNPPIYHKFLQEAYTIGDICEMIHPARFLFNAGATPKAWNEYMLNNSHLKILYYEQNSNKVFSNTDIKGGVTVTLYNKNRTYDPIGAFTPFEELRSIQRKVNDTNFKSLMTIVSNRGLYKYSDLVYEEHPSSMKGASDRRIAPSAFERMPDLFTNKKPNDGNEYIQIVGRSKSVRQIRWFRRDYVRNVENIEKYKVLVPKANGSGAIGEVLSTPLIGEPLIGFTETFISIGNFDSKFEAESAMKYIKTKFARAMLGILKVTQNNDKSTWKCVPLQDFTANSDIDWTKSIPEIDQQLYKKYGLSEEEIDFIETHVKEMD